MSLEFVGQNPQILKEWLASIPREDRMKEHFENYASVKEIHRFCNESFGEFVDHLMDEVTLVSTFQFYQVMFCSSFILTFASQFSGECPSLRHGCYSQNLESQGR